MAKARKLLVIDDDRVQQRLVQQLARNFRSAPFDLEEALTYDDGLKKLLTGKFAACLLDYRLGDRDGLALLREARIAGSETPVIVLTADDSEEVDLAAMEAGAADYLLKGGLTPRLLERSLQSLGEAACAVVSRELVELQPALLALTRTLDLRLTAPGVTHVSP